MKLYRLCSRNSQLATCNSKPKQTGVTLVELVVFIVIVSVSVAGVLIAIDRTARYSADPLITKQALMIAEALLEEVELMPFTFCDPDDPHVSTAQSATFDPLGLDPAKCSSAAQVENIGFEGETRYDAANPFDNVNDYDGFAMNPILDITGTPIGGLGTYSANVAVAPVALGGIAANDADGQANVLLITVTVNGPTGISVVLQGYRTKYAPNL